MLSIFHRLGMQRSLYQSRKFYKCGFLVQHATELPEVSENMESKPPLVVTPKHTWIESLQCSLPGSLADPALTSVKAVKADNAKVPMMSMWTDRITPIRPHHHWTPMQLDLMRQLMFHQQCCRLYLEFIGHMVQRHGQHDWLTALMSMHRSTLSASRSFCSQLVHEWKRVEGEGRENFTAHPL